MTDPRRKLPKATLTLRRPLSEQAQKRLAEIESRRHEIEREVEAEKPAMLAAAREHFRRKDAALAPLREAVSALRAEREAQGLSLADLENRAGISRPSLCRLENDLNGNPTIGTLMRIAEALGKEIRIALVDKVVAG